MQNKLQELTEKIYKEGISKGNEEAENIIKNAKSEADNIVSKAKKDAEKIIADANKKSSELQKNTESELKLSSKQAINALKQKIIDLINGEIVKNSVGKTFSDKEFIKETILTVVKNWASASGEAADLNVLISAKDEKELKDYFTKSAKNLIDKGLEIKFDETIKSGFQISPKDGSYKISFTDKDFENFFIQYLRPRLIELLFAEE